MTLPRRRLGTCGLRVSAVGLGCLPLSKFYGEPPSRVSGIRVLHHALDTGMDFFDTADAYGWGHNESLIGEALRGRRSQAVLATKVGHRRTASRVGFDICGRPEYIERACDESLRRLSTDYIDLYYLHRKDPDVPAAESMGALADLVHAGKVRFVGLSEVSVATLRECVSVHPVAAVESEYSLWTRDLEAEMLPACAELGIGFVPFAPLGRGMLTGTLSSDQRFGRGDMRRKLPRFQGASYQHNLLLLDTLRAIGIEKGLTLAQLAIAWLLGQREFIVPIPGADRTSYVQENASAAEISLSPEELVRISEAIPSAAVAGGRYDARSEATLDH